MPSLKDQDSSQPQPEGDLVMVLQDPRWPLPPQPFDEHYDFLFGVPYGLRDEQPKITDIGSRVNKRCAFCDRTEAETTFKKVAHLIPECLGNRHYVSNEECDECNETYGCLYEDELGRMFQVERAIQRVRTKGGGTAKVKSSTGTSYVGGGSFNTPLQIHYDEQDPFLRFQYVEGGAVLTVKAPPFKPIQALRSILKSAWLAIEPRRRERLGFLKRFIKGEICISPTEFFLFFQSEGWDAVFLEAWQRKPDISLPTAELVVRLTFGHFVLLWCAPDPESLEHRPSLLPPLLTPSAVRMRGVALDPDTAHSHAGQIDATLFRVPGQEDQVASRDISYSIVVGERISGISEETVTPTSKLITVPEKKPQERPMRRVRAEIVGTDETGFIEETQMTLFRSDARNDRYELRGGTSAASITFHEDRKTGKTRIDVRKQLHLCDALNGYNTMRFLRILFEKGGTFRITDLDTGEVHRDFPFSDGKSSGQYREFENFLGSLIMVNTKFGTDIRVPNPPCSLPWPTVAWLRQGAEQGIVERVSKDEPFQYSGEVTAEQAKEILETLRRGEGLTFAEENMELVILGTKINLGTVEHTLSKPRLEGSMEQLENAITKLTGEEKTRICILFDSIVDVFPKSPSPGPSA